MRRTPSSLAGYRCDYDDSFEASVAAANERTPEQWARAVFEDAPRFVRWFLLVGFRYGLNLWARRFALAPARRLEVAPLRVGCCVC